MPDALNLLEAQNRIAKAIEDKTATINVAAANPAITVVPATPAITVASALPTINVSPVDLSGVIEAINNLQINGGGGGSFDCNCLAQVLKPIVDVINNLRQDVICVIAPVAAATVQIQKTLAYYTEDGPHLGLDAPPGSFIFPRPDDTTPPITSTPDPTPTNNGGWTTPPTIKGITYVEPPGGMQGMADLVAHGNYKCDMATFIYEYVLSWYDTILEKIETVQTILLIVDVLRLLVDVLKGRMITKLPSAAIVYDAVAGITMKKATQQAGVTLLTAVDALVLGAFLISGAVLNWMIGISFSQYKENLIATKYDFICALYKARTINEAREGVMEALNKNVWHIVDFGQGSGAQGLFIRTLLSDNLLANLFACDTNLDPATIAGLGGGNCVACLACDDAEQEISLNLPATRSYYAEYDFGNRSVDLICVNVQSTACNQPPRVEVYLNGLMVCVGNFGTDNVPINVSLTPPATGVIPEGWDTEAGNYTKWTGHITIKVIAQGTIGPGNGIVRLNRIGWRDA